MTRAQATQDARTAKSFVVNGGPMAVVHEGPHADDYAERDSDGKSYGYCPLHAVQTLYEFGEVVEVIQ